MVGNISKWGCGTILVLIAFVVAVGIAGAILLPEPDERFESTKEPHKEEVLNPKEGRYGSPCGSPRARESREQAEVRADVEASTTRPPERLTSTYEHLTKMDRMSLSPRGVAIRQPNPTV